MYTYILFLLDFLPIHVTTEHWVEFPVLHRRFSLVTCFRRGSPILYVAAYLCQPQSPDSPPHPFPTWVSVHFFFMSVSLFLLCKQFHLCLFSRFRICVLTCNICNSLHKKISLYIIFSYFWLRWVCCCARAFSSLGEQGLRLWCVGFSLRWLLISEHSCRCLGFGICSTWAQQLWSLVALRYVESSRTRDPTCVPCIGRQTLNRCITREVLKFLIHFE